jgi:homoserine/homoserine lactone efflux protein
MFIGQPMIFPNHFFLYFLSSIVASLIPGLAVMGCFSTSMKYGFRAALILALGTITADIIYFILSGLGVIVLINDCKWLFFALKYAGIAYLYYLSIQCFLSKETQLHMDNSAEINPKVKKEYMFYFSGLALNLANPKNILFFLAILPQYIDLKLSITPQVFWLTLASELPAFSILLMYAFFAKKLQPILSKDNMAKVFNVIVGLLFTLTATVLLFT